MSKNTKGHLSPSRDNSSRFLFVLTAAALLAVSGFFVVNQARAFVPLVPNAYVNASMPDDSGDGLTPETAKKTIQAGIDLVDAGGTVNVLAGTYVEQVTITKNLHLTGAGVGTSIIQAPGTIPGSDDENSNIVKISGSGINVEIDGFTIAGPGPSGCGSIRAGIFVRDDANANIHGNRIQDIRDSSFSGCQNGVGILVGRNFWSTSGTASIDNNVIVDYQKGGIVIDNASSNATITNNIVTGAGTTDVIAQNGIQVSRGATASLSGNTVTGNSFHLVGNPWDWGAAGVLLYQAGAVTLSGGNIVSDNDQNLYIDSATAVSLGAETFGPSTAPINTGYDVINFTALDLDLTSVTFAGAASNFDIEDLIWHSVDDPATGLVTWVAGNLYVTTLSGTIQAAIDAAAPGDTINVEAGTYTENLTINKALTFNGPQAGVAVSGRTAGDSNESTLNGQLTIDADSVNVNGFTLTNPTGTYGVQIAEHTPSHTGISLTYNILDSISGSGQVKGVYLVHGPDNVTITHNLFSNISAVGTKSADAIFVGDSNSTDPSTGILIQDNVFNNITSLAKGAYGVLVNDGAGTEVQILDNTFSNLIGGWTHAIGLEGPTQNTTVTGNTFSDLSASGADRSGIFFEDNQYGETVTINHNKFNSSDLYGVAIHPDDLPGGTNGYSYVVTAQNNWWNDVSGPTHSTNPEGTGSAVSDNVTFTPWFVNSEMTILSDAVSGGDTVIGTDSDVSLGSGGEADLPEGITNLVLSDDSDLDLSGGLSGDAVTLNSGVPGDPIILTNSNLADVSASIPDGTLITGPVGWDGKITPPTAGTPSGNAPAGFSVGGTVISIGSSAGTLTFDNPVTILLAGVTGTVGYKPAGSDTWVQITNVCGGDYTTPTPPIAPGECAIDNGTDTKIVTFHFTSFGSLTANSTGGGGGGGGFIPDLTIDFGRPISVRPTSVTFTWATTYFSTSQVIYDTVPGKFNLNAGYPRYGYAFYKEGDDSGLIQVTGHSLTLYGLLPNVTYYYRLVSRGSLVISQEYSLTTLEMPAGGAAETQQTVPPQATPPSEGAGSQGNQGTVVLPEEQTVTQSSQPTGGQTGGQAGGAAVGQAAEQVTGQGAQTLPSQQGAVGAVSQGFSTMAAAAGNVWNQITRSALLIIVVIVCLVGLAVLGIRGWRIIQAKKRK